MDTQEYKLKKFDKLTRDVVQMVNLVPTFGYGDTADALAKAAMTNYLLTVVRVADLNEADVEILIESILEEMTGIANKLISNIKSYQQISDVV